MCPSYRVPLGRTTPGRIGSPGTRCSSAPTCPSAVRTVRAHRSSRYVAAVVPTGRRPHPPPALIRAHPYPLRGHMSTPAPLDAERPTAEATPEPVEPAAPPAAGDDQEKARLAAV